MNLPNRLTTLRILAAGAFIPFLLLGWTKVAFTIFVLASFTDWLDGYLARKMKLITNLGKFLDPLADKILVISALVCFVDLKWTAAWTVCVIVTREFAVTGLRLAALSAPKTEHTESGEEEKVVAPVISAAILGKIKTFVTMAALGVILFMHIVLTYLTADFISAHSIGRIVEITSDVLIYVSVLFTVLSGVDYFMKYGKFLKQ